MTARPAKTLYDLPENREVSDTARKIDLKNILKKRYSGKDTGDTADFKIGELVFETVPVNENTNPEDGDFVLLCLADPELLPKIAQRMEGASVKLSQVMITVGGSKILFTDPVTDEVIQEGMQDFSVKYFYRKIRGVR